MPQQIQQFMGSVRSGQVETVAAHLRRMPKLANAHDPDCFGAIPLKHAVDRGDIPMIDLLLDAGADIDGKSDWWAGGFGLLPCDNEGIAEYLVQRGLTVDAYAAAGMGWFDRLTDVLDRHPEQLNQKFGDGQRPLHVAKTLEVLDLLVARGADLEARDVDHCATAAQYLIRKPDLCRRLLEHGAAPDIFIACKLGRQDLAESMVAEDTEVFQSSIGVTPFDSPGSDGGHIYTYSVGCRPLTLAAREGHREFVDAMIPRASPSAALLFHAWEGDFPAAQAAAERLPGGIGSLSPRDLATIADAAWERRKDAVVTLLRLGVPVDACHAEDSTPLDRAAFHGFDDIVEPLLAHGASVDVVNRFGGTPLSACLHGRVHSWRKDGNYARCVRMLVDAGSRVDEKWIPTGESEIDAILRSRTT